MRMHKRARSMWFVRVPLVLVAYLHSLHSHTMKTFCNIFYLKFVAKLSIAWKEILHMRFIHTGEKPYVRHIGLLARPFMQWKALLQTLNKKCYTAFHCMKGNLNQVTCVLYTWAKSSMYEECSYATSTTISFATFFTTPMRLAHVLCFF